MILHRTKIPAIYVTHDQEEAFTIADRVLILHGGEIVRDGTPADVWANPKSAFVAEFLGLGNVLDGEVVAKNKFQTKLGNFTVKCAHQHSKEDKVKLLVRPTVSRAERSEPIGERRRSAGIVINGIVIDVLFQQDRYKVTLDNSLYVYLEEAPKVGGKISVQVKVECLA